MTDYGTLMTVREVTDDDLSFWEQCGERATRVEMKGSHIGAVDIQVVRCERDDPAFPACWRVPFVVPDGDGTTYWFTLFCTPFPPVAAVVQGESGVNVKPEREGREGDSQPMPTPNDHPDVQSAVIADILERREVGIRRYGTALQPHNGRNALLDAYEEALDLAMYLKQRLIEEETR